MDENKTHHHHSDHSHHHHSRHSKKKRTRFSKFMAENKRSLIGVGISLSLFLVIIAMVAVYQWQREPLTVGEDADKTIPTTSPQIQTDVVIPDGMVGLAVPHMTEPIPLADSWVTACVSDPDLTAVSQILEGYRNGTRLDRGLPVELSFEVTSLPKDIFVASSRITVSEDPNFGSSRNFNLSKDQRSVEVYLLKANTPYYYRVSVTLSDRSVTTIQGTFRTADTRRILSIEGAVNVRDIGGWKTSDGKTLRQGRLYRGSELDDATGKGYLLTDSGRQNLLTVLGIRMDMDLRTPEVASTYNALGENVTRTVYNAPQYEQIFTDSGKARMKEIFTDLADIENYPIYLHCTHGLDRTGTVVYLLQAVLGVSEADLIREYELSSLYYTGTSRKLLQPMIDGLNALGGDTMQENAETYLLSIGITESQLAALRAIYL